MPIKQISIGEYAIREWREDDAASIAKYANNKKIWNNLPDSFPNPYTIEDAKVFLSKVMLSEHKTHFAIESDHEAIGSISLMPRHDIYRFTAELGYWLAEPFWGKGIMTKATRVLSEYAFEELGLLRIFAKTYTTNTASIRMLEKSGFSLEGVLRASVFKDGRILDQCIYSKLNKIILQQNSPEPSS